MKIRYFLVASALSFLSACGGDNTATSADTTSTTINVFDGAAVGCSVTVSGVVASEIGDGAYSATGTFDDGVVIKATGCTDSDTELLLPDMFGVVQTGGGVVSPITTLIVQSILASDPAAISLSSDAIADAVAQIIANLGLTGYNPIDPTTANYVAAAKADTAGTGTEATAMRVAMAISTLLKGAEISVGTTDAGTMVMTIAQAIYESKSELDLTKSTGIEALLATAGTGASTSVSAALTVTATAVAPSVAMIINTTGAITDAINVTTAIVTILNDATDTSITDSTFSTQLTSAADTKAPVIALTGDNPMTIETGSSYSEPGTTVSDNVDTGLTATITGTVDAATVGSYKLSYNVTDTAGNQAVEITRTVNVVDTTAPVITLNGESSVLVAHGGVYVEPGATITENVDTGLTATITGTVDAATVGSYKLSYNVTDTAGNQAVEITRTVNVVDTTAPLITLNGESSVLVAHGGIYVEPGATITENVDTGLTSTVTGSVDTATLGDHVLTYNASDTAGNVADTKTRTVTVVDQTAPVITLIGDDPLILAHRATFTDAGTTVSDNIDIGLTTTVTGVVDTFTAGDYALTYNVSDAAGNEASAVTRTVTVSPSAHKIVAGYYDTCVYTDDDKELRCWGYNSGAHGSGHTESVGDEVEDMGAALIPTMLPDVELLDFAIGEEFGCGIFADKTTRCWGDNDTGQLGKGATGDALTEVQLGEALVPVDLGDDLYAVEIHANDYDTVCVLLNNGRIKCWGSEHSFTLGIPTDSHIGLTAESMGNNLLPIDFGINPDTNLPYKATTMSMDYYTACAALENGKVKCWGSNESGNLGLGEAEVYPFSSIGGNSGDMGDNLAYALLGDINVVKLITNYTATCALTDDNRMKCWGYNSNGQLGSNDSDDRGNGHDDSTNSLKYLDKVSQVFDIRELNAANDGSTLCPGAPDNKGVQLVYGNDDGIPSGTALDQILDDGEIDTNIVKCDTAELTAFAVEDLSYSSTTSDKLAYGLKASDYSEMGDNLPFVDLGTTDVIKKMAIGYAITCALFETGKVKCWGSHYSNGADLPDNIGHAPEHSVAVANYVDLGTTDKVVDIAAGGYQTCVVFETAKVKCWGYSDYGELGLPQLSGNIGDGDPEPEMGENLPYVDFR